jgi:hypothetical protein
MPEDLARWPAPATRAGMLRGGHALDVRLPIRDSGTDGARPPSAVRSEVSATCVRSTVAIDRRTRSRPAQYMARRLQ